MVAAVAATNRDLPVWEDLHILAVLHLADIRKAGISHTITKDTVLRAQVEHRDISADIEVLTEGLALL